MKHSGNAGPTPNGSAPNQTAGSSGSVHKSECIHDTTWNDFIARSRALLAKSADVMTGPELDELEAISDALIHLVGYASASSEAERDSDPSVRELLAWRRRRERARALSAGGGVLSSDERQTLRARILAGLQASQLRVREVEFPPYERAMAVSRVTSPDLLRELEQLHRAVVVPELAIAAGAGLELWDVACTTTVDVPEDVPQGAHLALAVSGDSMEPLIQSGDLVLVRLDDKAVPGSVIVARDPDHGYLVKEVVSLTLDGIELRSLNPMYPAVRVPHGPNSVLGTVVLRWRR